MAERHVRTLCWIACTLLSVPIILLSLAGWTLLSRTWPLPSWVHGLASFSLFAGIYVGMGYLTAALLEKRYPDGGSPR